jgi:hypothetical protein
LFILFIASIKSVILADGNLGTKTSQPIPYSKVLNINFIACSSVIRNLVISESVNGKSSLFFIFSRRNGTIDPVLFITLPYLTTL